MAQTFKRICLYDHELVDGDKRLDLKRGQEYLTSAVSDGQVTVLSSYWTRCPVEWFAGEVEFTPATERTSEEG